MWNMLQPHMHSCAHRGVTHLTVVLATIMANANAASVGNKPEIEDPPATLRSPVYYPADNVDKLIFLAKNMKIVFIVAH